MTQNNAPRLLLAGTGSGCGKTTVTTAILRALQRRGVKLSAFKCGPDYIDPMFHTAVLGVPSRNLDLFFEDETGIRSQLARHIQPDGLGVIEGVMGFYDGVSGTTDTASAAHLARATGTPAVLIVRPKGQSLSLAAQIHGFRTFAENTLAGVILNGFSIFFHHFLGQISYITEALATVLQLGVTMDFSIFLLHRYEEEKELRSSNEEAMTSAICKTMTSISASSLTTIAGFLALCAMRLTLGRDIGLVMAKGVALGVICTVVILPSLILTFDKWVEKYKHRTVIPRLTKLSYFVSKHSVPIVAVFILILIPFAIAQNKTSVYYTLFDSLPQDLTGIVGTNKLGEDFGMTTSHFILVHDDLTATQVSDLCDELKDVDGITQVVSLDSITGPGFDTELLPDSVMEILQSGGYKLILANSSYKTGTDAINSQLDEMIGLIKNVDSEGVITGEGAMTKDLIEVADVDFKNVNVWSIMAVLVIIAISFKSISIPVLLVASIEAAIAINMGIPYFTGTQLPFIASIVIGTIQLGATVDYSILMTTRYHEERAFGRTPKEAAQQSLEHCSQSILTSGLTFFAATVGVAAISKMELLRSICLLISRGALISMLVILVMLPAALMLCDWLIRHTTLKWMVPESANAKKSEKE